MASKSALKDMSSIRYEDIGKYTRRVEVGRRGMPTCVQFSPDDQYVTYLKSEEGGLRQTIFALEMKSGKTCKVVDLDKLDSQKGEESELSAEEKLRRERLRQLHTGITSYSWGSNGKLILIPIAGSLYLKEGISGPIRKLIDGKSGDLPGSVMDARLSSDESSVVFVCDSEVYLCATDGKSKPFQVTFGAREKGLTNGIADYVAQEEMSRYEGFWMSPDGSRVAFEQVDETHIPKFRIMHQGSDRVGPNSGAEEDHRYPFAGAANPKVKLGITSTKPDDRQVEWLDLEQCYGADLYLARVSWIDSNTLMFIVQNREQSKMTVRLYDLPSKSYKTLVEESEERFWLNLHDVFIPLSEKGTFLWASERTGFKHLYKIFADGKDHVALTEGKWVVDRCDGSFIDEANGRLFFMGTKTDCKECHLYSVGLNGDQKVEQVTSERGMHSAVLSHGKEYFVDVHSNLNTPYSATLRTLKDAKVVHTLHGTEWDAKEITRMNFVTPVFDSTVCSDKMGVDGEHPEIHMVRYMPPKATFGEGPFPTVVAVYGGPHFQAVTDSWNNTADLRAQHFAQNGIMVVKVDNRGATRRGLKFEGALKYDMGNVEVMDQVKALQHLQEKGLAKKAKAGIYGWSYGGYMTLMCMARCPEHFGAGVSGAPVTHWDGYDTHYTERYMGTPQGNPKGYHSSAVMTHVKGLKGSKLMLIHGLIDENVHFRHTARLINALIAERVDYKLSLYPDERHQPRKLEDRTYMEEQIFGHFAEFLLRSESS